MKQSVFGAPRVRPIPVLLLVLAAVVGAVGWSCGRPAARSKVVVIGLDGATFDLLNPWLAAGELPNLKGLMDRGVWGPLTSVYPIISPVAWTCATTGVNPGKHGIYGFERPDPEVPGAQLLYTSEQRKAAPIWTLLGDAGLSTALLNIPMTWPPDKVNGVMVSGFPFPEDTGRITWTHPPELQGTLANYPLDRMGESLVPGAEGDMLAKIVDSRDAVARVAMDWFTNRSDDFTWVVFTAPDRIQHFFWGMMDEKHPYWTPEKGALYGNAIHEFWLAMDRRLGELLATLPEDATVFVISDHGFTPIYREMNMYNWFDQTTLPDFVRQNRVHDVYITNGIFNYRLGTTWPMGPEYDEFRTRFQKEATAFVDPATGRPAVERVPKREELFSGWQIGKAPDLVMIEAPGYYIGAGDPNRDLPPCGDLHSTSYSAYHRPNGIFVAAGPKLRKGELSGASLLDVTPTLLHLMGQSVPGEMDGRVIEAIFNAEWLGKNRPRYVEGTQILTDRPERKLTAEEREQLEAVPYSK
jgi:predicted AlkP superfamily phosphohydrolase/phosphomutase